MRNLIGVALMVALMTVVTFVFPQHAGLTSIAITRARSQVTRKAAQVSINRPENGQVFYGAFTQTLSGEAKYGDGTAVPADRLRWSKTIGGKTTVIGTGGSVNETFSVGTYKLTLEALNAQNSAVGSASVSVTFYASIR